ncbi:type II toxin-antitoxin system RnlB family antitoxin [Enterococcus faecalis]|uniref:type II toxin-antitoxin system RnlB family antitoxin n=1 Tax=Enterococcus faecalis TaxID=1351 RepID=UPI003CC60CAD
MRNYNFLKTSMDFEYVLVGHSFVHPISYLQEVEAFLRTNEFEGYILLDGLLSNGFSDNRFAKVFFDGKRFDMMNIDLVNHVSDEVNNYLYSYYKDNKSLIENSSIIPNAQKYLLVNGLLIKEICLA